MDGNNKRDNMTFYDMLPYFLKQAAVNFFGYWLKKNRYNHNSEIFFKKAMERERWSQKEWQLWQRKQVLNVLKYAAEYVPYYKDYWMNKKKADILNLNSWPVLDKETVRKNYKRLISSQRVKMFTKKTSGTEGKPLKTVIDKEGLSYWYSIFWQRIKSDYNIENAARWAILGGRAIVSARRTKPPYWIFNKALNQVYLSTFHISEETADDYAFALRKYRPAYMIVYPSACSSLAEHIMKKKLIVPDSLKVIYSNAEILSDCARRIITKAFNCKVIDTYGMTEMVCGGTECLCGKLHLWPDVGKIEILSKQKDIPVEPGEKGRIIATSLNNYGMPLIRYDTGDCGIVVEQDCLCGREMPILEKLVGREKDVLKLTDGRELFWINTCFYDLPIINSQVIQEKDGKIRVLIVVDNNFCRYDEIRLERKLREVLGNDFFKIERKKSSELLRTTNNKIKNVIRIK